MLESEQLIDFVFSFQSQRKENRMFRFKKLTQTRARCCLLLAEGQRGSFKY